jgi:ectoine hydroxylase-related dioxygenase (phytanoyl-CoA dioxygenase family)
MYSDNGDYRRAVFESIAPLVRERIQGVLDRHTVCVANWVVKEAGSADSTVQFHQDWSFVDETRWRSINLWFPLIDVDEENGCLQVVAGSHRVSTDHRSHADRCRFDDLSPVIRDTYLQSVPMKAGEGIFYDGALLHASQHNRSSRRRVAAGTVLVPENVSAIHAFRTSPTSVDVFEVDSGFFWSHQPGNRPVKGRLVGTVPSSTTQHDQAALELLIARA